jgi:hypothetical protein
MVGIGESGVAEGPFPFPAPNYSRGNFSLHTRPHEEKYLQLWISVQIIPMDNQLLDTIWHP